MKNFLIKTAEGKQPKIGRSALIFGADAEIAGAKGDFSIHGRLLGKTDVLGLWVYLEKDANIEKLDIQVYDTQSETLMMLIPADWSGWKWVEFATAGNRVQQAYPQPDKNSLIDQPLNSQQVVWFTFGALVRQFKKDSPRPASLSPALRDYRYPIKVTARSAGSA